MEELRRKLYKAVTPNREFYVIATSYDEADRKVFEKMEELNINNRFDRKVISLVILYEEITPYGLSGNLII